MRLILALITAVVVVGATLVPAAADEAAPFAVRVTKNVEIPVSSGTVLRGDLYLPVIDRAPGTDLPTVVTYFPYIKDDPNRFEVEGMFSFASAGYAALLVDIAGTGVSPGEYGFINEREVRDGHDVVEWAAAQPFSNGRVGMWGYSFPGVMAAHVAATQPPSLRAIVPASIFHDPYRDIVYPGGILTTQDGAGLLPWAMSMSVTRQRQDTDPQLGLEALIDSVTTPGGLITLGQAPLHRFYDEYWQERALENKAANIEVPTLLWGGWADIYQRATLLLHHDIGAEHVGMVIGPWGHLAGARGEPLQYFLDESVRWFDTFVRQEPSREQAGEVATVRVFDNDWTADDRYLETWPGRWVDLPSWPPATVETTLSLCAASVGPDAEAPWPLQGGLVEDCPEEGSLPVLPVPVDATGGGYIGHDAVPDAMLNVLWDDKDQRLSPTATAFVGEPTVEDAVLSGPMTVRLAARTFGTDAEWVVRVVDIGPDGARVISPGWLRASRRHEDTSRGYVWHTHDRDEPVVPGESYELTIEIWPNSYVLPAGHRLGLIIRTADTLKSTAGVGSAPSELLFGPGTSTLTYSTRITTASGTATPTGAVAQDIAQTDELPATGGGVAFLALALSGLALVRRTRR